MASARTVILCSYLLGLGLSACALSPLTEQAEQSDEQPVTRDPSDDADDDDDRDPPPDDSDDDQAEDDDDDAPPVRDGGAKDSGTNDAASGRDGAVDAGSRPSDDRPDAAGPTPTLDAGEARPDAAAPSRDAAVSDAGAQPADAASVRDAAPPPPPICAAGTYRGSFSGQIRSGGESTGAKGSVTLVLTGGEPKLNIQEGTFSGQDDGGHALRARITGALNCTTRALEGARLLDGVYDMRVGLLSSISFTGALTGNVGGNPAQVQGNWTLESNLGTRSGSGTFNANKQ